MSYRDNPDEHQKALMDAMDRLLAGAPVVAEPGDLTDVALIAEAGVKRWRLTHDKEVQLDWHGRRKAAQAPPDPRIEQLEERVAEYRRLATEHELEMQRWKADATAAIRAVQALHAKLNKKESTIVDLTRENKRLRANAAAHGNVITIR